MANWWDSAPVVEMPKSAKSAPPPAAPERSFSDIARGYGKAALQGLENVVAGTAGLPRTLSQQARQQQDILDAQLKDAFGAPPTPQAPGKEISWPRTEDIQQKYYDVTGLKPYQTKGPGEHAVQTVAEFAPAAFGGEGGLFQRLMRVLSPAAGSEGAGAVADEIAPDLAPLARFIGAMGGEGVRKAITPHSTRETLAKFLPRGVTEADAVRADALMQNASRLGIPLTPGEALSQVTGRNDLPLSNLERHLAAHPDTAGTMSDFYGDRAARVDQAANRELARVAPGPPPIPEPIGPRVGQAAADEVERVRSGITQRSGPYYDAARETPLSDLEMGYITTRPGYQAARDAVANPDHARHSLIADLVGRTMPPGTIPENTIGFQNEVKKELKRMADNAIAPMNPNRDTTESGLLSRSEDAVRRTLVRSSARQDPTGAGGPYGTALQHEASSRETLLDPLYRSPLGPMAEKAGQLSTDQASQLLFPAVPRRNSHIVIGDTVARLVRQDPEAASQLVRNHIETVFDQASRDNMAGPSGSGGAKFRSQLIGNPQNERNVRAAIEALPDGRTRWEGIKQFLDVLEATGRRQNVGSKTAYNVEFDKAINPVGAVEATGKMIAQPASAARPLVEKYNLWKAGKNLGELADIATNSRNMDLFRQIAASNAGSFRAHNLARALIYGHQLRSQPEAEAAQ